MSTIDLSEKLRAARRHPAWSSERLKGTLARLAAAIPASNVDHDEDAGEEWGRLVLSDQIVAILWSRGAFAFVHAEFADLVPLLASDGVLAEVVADWDERSYRVQSEDLRSLFDRDSISDMVDPDKLSANELWWATT